MGKHYSEISKLSDASDSAIRYELCVYNAVVSFMHVAWRLKRAYEGKINGLVNAGQKVA
jgi:hypothetical protein